MKRPFTTLTLLLAVAAISTAPAHSQTPSAPPSPPIAGGYSAVSAKDPDVVEAAKFAFGKQKKSARPTLVSLENAQRQVVAGMNYRIGLKLKSGGKISRVKTVVYRNLQGKLSLTSWTIIAPKVVAPKMAPKK